MVSTVNAAQFSLEYSHIMKNFNEKNNNYLNFLNSKDLKKYKSDQSIFKENTIQDKGNNALIDYSIYDNDNYMTKISLFSVQFIDYLLNFELIKNVNAQSDRDNYYKNSYSSYQNDDYVQYHEKNRMYAEIERFDDKLFVCDNGIVVDHRTQCPLKCPFGTTLEGAYVMDLDICDIESSTLAQKCGPDTDIPGIVTMSQEQCEIFAECDADSPLGLALGGLGPIKVADVQLCQLHIPGMAVCDSGFFEGFVVENESVCDTVFNKISVCGPTSDVAGMLTTNPESCNLLTTCDANSNLGQSLGNTPITVVDEELCNLEIPEQIEVFQCDLDTPMGGVLVTNPLLCQAPNDSNKCPSGTDLSGAYVMDPASDCTIFATCDAGTALGKALGMQNEFKVADEVLCDLEIPQVEECPAGTDLEGVFCS